MSGCSCAASTNHGKATAKNNSTPLTQGSAQTLRHCQVHNTHKVSTNRQQQANQALAQHTQRTGHKAGTGPVRMHTRGMHQARAKHQIATPIQVATTMSWLRYCPPTKNAKLVPNIQAARHAVAAPAM